MEAGDGNPAKKALALPARAGAALPGRRHFLPGRPNPAGLAGGAVRVFPSRSKLATTRPRQA